MFIIHKSSGFFLDLEFYSHTKSINGDWSSFYSAYINVMNRDIFPAPLQMFINCVTAIYFKCILSHRVSSIMVFIQLRNTKRWECVNRTS